MAVKIDNLKNQLEKNFPNAIKLDIKDFVGDQNHYAVTVIDASFKGLTVLEQHRMVYKAISSLLQSDLHAIDLRTNYKI